MCYPASLFLTTVCFPFATFLQNVEVSSALKRAGNQPFYKTKIEKNVESLKALSG